MAPPSFSIHIMDVYTCPSGDLMNRQTIWRRRDTISLAALHRIDPLMDMPFQVVFFIRRAFNLGFSNDGLNFETIWQPAGTLSATGRYDLTTPAVLSFSDLPEIPPSPARALDDALHGSDREAIFNGLVDGAFGQSTYPGIWSLTAMVMVFDPAAPDSVLSVEVSQPWNYTVRNYV